MNPWPFVIAAYGMVGLGTLGLLIQSWIAMRRTEAAADAVRGQRP